MGKPYQPVFLVRGRASRGPRRVGEIFAVPFRGLGVVFGRVAVHGCAEWWNIETDSWKISDKLYVVYFFKQVGKTIRDVPDLSVSNLLFAPMKIDACGWSFGYFSPIGTRPFAPGEQLEKHCFGTPSHPYNLKINPRTNPIVYRDELGNKLDRRYDPCRHHGFGSFGWVENEIAGAFGIL